MLISTDCHIFDGKLYISDRRVTTCLLVPSWSHYSVWESPKRKVPIVIGVREDHGGTLNWNKHPPYVWRIILNKDKLTNNKWPQRHFRGVDPTTPFGVWEDGFLVSFPRWPRHPSTWTHFRERDPLPRCSGSSVEQVWRVSFKSPSKYVLRWILGISYLTFVSVWRQRIFICWIVLMSSSLCKKPNLNIELNPQNFRWEVWFFLF